MPAARRPVPARRRLGSVQLSGKFESIAVHEVFDTDPMDMRIAKEFAPLKLDNATLTTKIDRLDETSWSEAGLDTVHLRNVLDDFCRSLADFVADAPAAGQYV